MNGVGDRTGDEMDDDSTQNDSTQSDSVQDESTRNESAQKDSVQNESVQNESVQNESVQDDSTRSGSTPGAANANPDGDATDGRERRRPTWNTLRGQLDAVGFRPSKRLGQNFLVDDGLCRAVAVAAGPIEADSTVLEVGVGLGFLTHHLLATGARVIGVEIDDRLADLALSWLEPAPGFELVRTDVLAGKHELAPALVEQLPTEGDWLLASNLPYAVASPVVALLASLSNPPRSMTVLVQHEVAERLCAAPGSPNWGVLGARLALGYTGRLVRAVGAAGFRPRPKVDSSICRLERRTDGPNLSAVERAAYDEVAAAVFTQRRKRLRHPLAGLVGGTAAADAWLDAAGIDRELRVEAVRPDQLIALLGAPAGLEIQERIAGRGPSAR